VLALVLDALVPEPAGRWHPVAWMGSLIARGRDALIDRAPGTRLLGGAWVAVGGAGLMLVLGLIAALLLRSLPVAVAVAGEAVILRMMLSRRGLNAAARGVAAALTAGDLALARQRLGWNLVSRPTDELTDAEVAAGAVESVAENTSDSVVGPLVFYLLLGPGGALAYRFANTADAMLGYRTGAYQQLGKVPARLDDLLNWLPARLTGLAIIGASPFAGGDARGAARCWWRDRGATASVNAGQPISAVAGALGVRLGKPGVYEVGAGGRPARAGDIHRAGTISSGAVLLLVVACLGGFLIWRFV
jgi:adenosylcobinamide-phosphate synthase